MKNNHITDTITFDRMCDNLFVNIQGSNKKKIY